MQACAILRQWFAFLQWRVTLLARPGARKRKRGGGCVCVRGKGKEHENIPSKYTPCSAFTPSSPHILTEHNSRLVVNKLALLCTYCQPGMAPPTPQLPRLPIAQTLRLIPSTTLQTVDGDCTPQQNKVNRNTAV